MATPVPTADELKSLTPEERIKKLKQLEEQRRKEMEEAKKKAEEEIQLAEELIEKSKEELEEEEKDEEKKDKKKGDDRKKQDEEATRREKESLEEMLAKEKATQNLEEIGRQYNTNLYEKPKEKDLYADRLGNTNEYDRNKREEESKKEYSLPMDSILEQMDAAHNIVGKMKYKR